MASKSYFVDDKFDVILGELRALGDGWTRAADMRQCSLLWTNLRNVDWEDLLSADPRLVVNHLKGSQHLSNKAFLAYHMHMSGRKAAMPMQWSAAYQDLAELLGMVLVTALYGCCLQLQEQEQEGGCADAKSAGQVAGALAECTKMQRVLLMDAEWAASPGAACARALLASLQAVAAAPAGSDARALDAALHTAEVQMQCRSCYGSTNLWIVKPVGGSCGENISLCRGARELLQRVAEMQYKCVVQKYIERPLLVRQQRKFDIRQWVLVTSIDPVVVYGFSECYGRLSGKAFHLGAAALSDKVVHLCNNAVQASADSYTDGLSGPGGAAAGEEEEEQEQEQEPLCDTMMTQQQLARDMDASKGEGVFAGVVLPQIRRISVDAVFSVRDKLTRVAAGFEWLGLDFMVTDALEVQLLEVNVSPDLTCSTGVTSRLVRASAHSLLPLLLGDQVPAPEAAAGAGALRWDAWYPLDASATDALGAVPAGAERATPDTSTMSVLQFARKKREGGILRVDYSPQKKHVADRVHSILAGAAQKRQNDAAREEEEEEDEEEL